MSRLMNISMPSARDEANALITALPMTHKIITTAGISNKVMFTRKLLTVRVVVTTKRNDTTPWLQFTLPV